MRRSLLFVLILFFVTFAPERNVRAQQSGSIDYANWMAGLDDNLFLMRLSIPGTHDAATKGLSSVGETQTKSIAEQLACGIRMFDRRPRVKDNKLMIYHGILATDVSFDDAMSTLCTFLDKHPRECLFVIMRHEDDGASDSEKSQWPSKMYEALSARRGYIVDYSPAMTVRDLRGKILVMSRNTYDNGPIGAYLEGGGDNTVYDRTIVGRNGGMAITAPLRRKSIASTSTTLRATPRRSSVSSLPLASRSAPSSATRRR